MMPEGEIKQSEWCKISFQSHKVTQLTQIFLKSVFRLKCLICIVKGRDIAEALETLRGSCCRTLGCVCVQRVWFTLQTETFPSQTLCPSFFMSEQASAHRNMQMSVHWQRGLFDVCVRFGSQKARRRRAPALPQHICIQLQRVCAWQYLVYLCVLQQHNMNTEEPLLVHYISAKSEFITPAFCINHVIIIIYIISLL